MWDWEMRDQNAGLRNAGPKNAGPENAGLLMQYSSRGQLVTRQLATRDCLRACGEVVCIFH